MLCVQIVTKFLFHCGFHTKKTLRCILNDLYFDGQCLKCVGRCINCILMVICIYSKCITVNLILSSSCSFDFCSQLATSVVLLLIKFCLCRGPAMEWYDALHPYLLFSAKIRRWFMDTVFMEHRGRFSEYLLECPSNEVWLQLIEPMYGVWFNCHPYLIRFGVFLQS